MILETIKRIFRGKAREERRSLLISVEPLEKRVADAASLPIVRWLVAISVILLAAVPRLVHLGQRPLMHDESLFAY